MVSNILFGVALNSSLTPTTPTSPNVTSAPPSPSTEGKPKKSNPLIDLIETEKVYVDQLTGIIRVCATASISLYFYKFHALIQKIAAAWSRSNLPPPELDGMFRNIESVYKANRSLLSVRKLRKCYFIVLMLAIALEIKGYRYQSLFAQGSRRSSYAMGKLRAPYDSFWAYFVIRSMI